jgi:hypothetical protein
MGRENVEILTIEEESQDLEIHVKLCAQRYYSIMNRLDHMETKIEEISNSVKSLHKILTTVLLSSLGLLCSELMPIIFEKLFK